MKSRILIAPTMLASIAWFCACAGPLPRGKDGVTAIQFQDMVVPAGLCLIDDAHQSHSVEAASWRYGRFVYTGMVKPAEAASYVRQRMPLHAWQCVRDVTTPGDRSSTTQRFERAHYVAEYCYTRIEGQTQLVIEYDTDYTPR
ncbi:MAG: hypothetical protein KDC98_17270 [Planctomycetes bacterium]|nr:hypothetical protein [Planctomycetota bacterium]